MMFKLTPPRFTAALAVLVLSVSTDICPAQTEKKQPDNALIWVDALELGIEGQAWKQAELKHPYDRLPAEAEGKVTEKVWHLSHHTAGLNVRFVTDSPTIAARWTLRFDALDMHHMPSTGVSGLDLYAKDSDGQWRWVGRGRPKEKDNNEWKLINNAPPGEHEYRLYLPLYNGVESLQIGIQKGSTLRPAPAYPSQHAKPILFWGTSILQGGCASRPGMAYPSILGRRLKYPVINMGFSGNGKMDPPIIDLISRLDVAAYVIDCAPNMTTELIAERAEPLITTLHAAHPETPIVIIENVRYQDIWFNASHQRSVTEKNAELRRVYDKLHRQMPDTLFYIPADRLLGDDGEATVDGIHPNDLGFMRMANTIEPILRTALGLDPAVP